MVAGPRGSGAWNGTTAGAGEGLVVDIGECFLHQRLSTGAPFQKKTVNLSHCARFVFLSRAIDETDSPSVNSGRRPVPRGCR